MIDFTKTPILPNYQVPNGLFCKIVDWRLNSFKVALFFLSVSLKRKERKFKKQKPGLNVLQ